MGKTEEGSRPRGGQRRESAVLALPVEADAPTVGAALVGAVLFSSRDGRISTHPARPGQAR